MKVDVTTDRELSDKVFDKLCNWAENTDVGDQVWYSNPTLTDMIRDSSTVRNRDDHASGRGIKKKKGRKKRRSRFAAESWQSALSSHEKRVSWFRRSLTWNRVVKSPVGRRST